MKFYKNANGEKVIEYDADDVMPSCYKCDYQEGNRLDKCKLCMDSECWSGFKRTLIEDKESKLK